MNDRAIDPDNQVFAALGYNRAGGKRMRTTLGVHEVTDVVRDMAEAVGRHAKKIGLDRAEAMTLFNTKAIGGILTRTYGGSYESDLSNAVNAGLDKVFSGTEQPLQERNPEPPFEDDPIV